MSFSLFEGIKAVCVGNEDEMKGREQNARALGTNDL